MGKEVKMRHPSVNIDGSSNGFKVRVSYSIRKEKEGKGDEVRCDHEYKDADFTAESVDDVLSMIKPYLEGIEKVTPNEEFLEAFNSDVKKASKSMKMEAAEEKIEKEES